MRQHVPALWKRGEIRWCRSLSLPMERPLPLNSSSLPEIQKSMQQHFESGRRSGSGLLRSSGFRSRPRLRSHWHS